MEEVPLPDTQTTPTTEMIPSSGKRVRRDTLSGPQNSTDIVFYIVCVSSILVDEIKRIIKTSEIMKYVPPWKNVHVFSSLTPTIGKMTVNGLRRIRMDDRSWRYEWAASTYPLRYEGPSSVNRILLLM